MLKRLKGQKGFTLIELVMVIVILGILAAVAIPRYIDLQEDARAAAVRGVEGAVRGAAAIVHAKALLSAVTNGTVTAEGVGITVVNSYPATAAGGIDAAVGGVPSGFSFGAGSFQKIGATTPANCSVTYTQPAGAGQSPTITVDTSDC